MADSDVSGRFVTLRGGFTVATEAYLLLLKLEERGFRLQAESDHTLLVQPADRLTRQDCAALRRWKAHLLALIDYCGRPGLDAHLFSDVPVTGSDVRRSA